MGTYWSGLIEGDEQGDLFPVGPIWQSLIQVGCRFNF